MTEDSSASTPSTLQLPAGPEGTSEDPTPTGLSITSPPTELPTANLFVCLFSRKLQTGAA